MFHPSPDALYNTIPNAIVIILCFFAVKLYAEKKRDITRQLVNNKSFDLDLTDRPGLFWRMWPLLLMIKLEFKSPRADPSPTTLKAIQIDETKFGILLLIFTNQQVCNSIGQYSRSYFNLSDYIFIGFIASLCALCLGYLQALVHRIAKVDRSELIFLYLLSNVAFVIIVNETISGTWWGVSFMGTAIILSIETILSFVGHLQERKLRLFQQF